MRARELLVKSVPEYPIKLYVNAKRNNVRIDVIS